MCSSPKSSRAVKKTNMGFDNELTQEQRIRFAAKANLAQERKEQREAANRHYEQKNTQAKPKPQFNGFFAKLQQLLS
jgi:hypothetical protein